MIENHVLDDIPAYSLGALSEPDRQRVQTHLSICHECRLEYKAFQEITEILPVSAAQYEPPQRLRTAILKQIETPPENNPSSFNERITTWLRPLSTPLWGGMSLAIILVLSVSNLMFWQKNRLTNQSQSEFRFVQMTAEKSAADAGGVIVMSNDGNFGTLIVDGLPALDSARQYQLWLINEGKRTSGGVFSVMDNGYGVLIVNSSKPLSTYQNFGITIEPFGGSSGPTGDKVLGGKI